MKSSNKIKVMKIHKNNLYNRKTKIIINKMMKINKKIKERQIIIKTMTIKLVELKIKNMKKIIIFII